MNTSTIKHANASTKAHQPPSRETKRQPIHIEFSDSAAESVAIAGTFNDWRPEATPMIAVGNGHWIKDLTLPPGTYEYCLVVDGSKWLPDPQAGETAPNPFGGKNSVLKVPIAT